MREHWARAFAETARAYWTAERTADLVRDKSLAILPGEDPELLRAIGILHRDGSMPPRQARKFFQINHLVAALGPSFREIAGSREVIRIVDAACGRSYLTLLLGRALPRVTGRRVEILGVDRSAALVEESARRTDAAGLGEVVRHHASPLDELDAGSAFAAAFPDHAGDGAVDAVVSLHACDTATDDAIELGVRLEATLVSVTPCCQAELARGWSALAPAGAGPFAPIHRAGHLRREAAAVVTDTLRALLLRAAGYETSALELAGTEHTAKNTLLRAMNRRTPGASARAEYEALVQATGGVGIGLASRIGARRG